MGSKTVRWLISHWPISSYFVSIGSDCKKQYLCCICLRLMHAPLWVTVHDIKHRNKKVEIQLGGMLPIKKLNIVHITVKSISSLKRIILVSV